MSQKKKTVITSKPEKLSEQLREVWNYRELLLVLAYRDFRLKYAQAFLGITWAVLNPTINLILLSFVFHYVTKVETAGTPPLLFTMVGLVGWTYFSEVFSGAGDAVLNAQQMVRKIYFPRLILPLSKAITALIDLGIALVLLLGLWIAFGFWPSSNIIYFPLFLFLAMLTALTGGIWLSALTIRYRDFRYISPVLLRLGLFITPIAYAASEVPEQWRALYFLNPLAAAIEGFRWSLIEGAPFPHEGWLGFIILVLLFVGGLFYFSKMEAVIADII